ncbi:unnamed protein product [Rotaria magnacalcarata]|uniref:DYW domain-containing protein n=1 Tax=Rotaria magnacalcarata TaxID=392030 RepID=A0A819JPT4_9BILA|nr:unnamed protein product [Rotaria magnacalcarata]
MIILIHNHQQSMLNRFRFESIDSSWIARQLNKDKTIESVLCGHSEKLAIAFKLIPQPLPEFTQITKDLRICDAVTKLRHIDIIIRDAYRIHYFHKNGQCSSQDHFG